MIRPLCLASLAASVAIVASPAVAQISDNFEVDSSASFTVVDDSNGASGDGGADSTVEFAYDYVAAGIPLAPNSAAGDVGGLRMTVNATEEGDEGQSATEEDHVTAFSNLMIADAFYRLDVDIYMGVDAGASGTTEFAHVGVAGDSSDFTSIFTPVVANGHFMSMTGEGGSGSDYRHSIPGTGAVGSGDLSYLNDANTTNSSGDTYQNLFPNTAFPGSPTNIWTTMTITVNPDVVTYWLDGTPIIQTPTLASNGLVSLGLTDPFDSVGPHFVIYDNLSVTAVPEPAAAFLALLGCVAMTSRRVS